jgi:putative transposase
MDEEIPMKKSRFTEAQIMGVLRRAEGGIPVPELCREHGISSATFYIEPSRRHRSEPDGESGRSMVAWMRP